MSCCSSQCRGIYSLEQFLPENTQCRNQPVAIYRSNNLQPTSRLTTRCTMGSLPSPQLSMTAAVARQQWPVSSGWIWFFVSGGNVGEFLFQLLKYYLWFLRNSLYSTTCNSRHNSTLKAETKCSVQAYDTIHSVHSAECIARLWLRLISVSDDMGLSIILTLHEQNVSRAA